MDTDVCSVGSGPASLRFAPSVATSATSHDWDMRSASPAPSVYSMTSSLRAASYRHEFGRGINNYSEVYRLPADDEEFERLDQQHIMFMEVMGRYPPPLPEILADDTPGGNKTCVDLGCGSGSWILDIARDFPHCSAVAVDLVPMQDVNMPPNCRSEVDDINLGLQHFYGQFNVAHARLVSSGIRDYKGLIDEMTQTLRPRGLIILSEFDFRVYDANRQPIMPSRLEEESPWLARWMNMVNIAVEQRGGEPDAANHLHRWMRDNGQLEEIVYNEYWIQTGPWKRGPDHATAHDNWIGAMMRDDILAFLKSGRPLLLGNDMDIMTVDELETNAERELLEATVQTYIRVQRVYARRKAY
ncbi:S-adenosyl-L-methionine-dependent methyltransferase [Trametes elegans]|nr:S-adenosyl-L-methionine-dependent methyltransferase [Trametes elegans]